MTEISLSNFEADDDFITEFSEFVSAKHPLVKESRINKGWNTYMSKDIFFSVKCYTFLDAKGDSDKQRPSFLPGISISFNWLSDFDSFKDLQSWMEETFETYFEAIKEFKITRLDVNLNLKIPYSRIKHSLERPKNRTWQEFISSSKTLYLGKKPRQVTVYEKDFKKSQIDYPKKSKKKGKK